MSFDKKEIAAAYKEGGKKGQDLIGMADMGGIKFFNVAIDQAQGAWELLDETMKGANKEVDENAEERKGGAGDLGKILFSAGNDLIMYAHCPKALAAEKGITLRAWVDAVNAAIAAEVIEESEEYIKSVAKGDPNADRFPLKMRDVAISAGFEFLRANQLVLDEESDEDDVNYAEAAGIEW